jgi:P-type conjugative transfer protein TrbJ
MVRGKRGAGRGWQGRNAAEEAEVGAEGAGVAERERVDVGGGDREVGPGGSGAGGAVPGRRRIGGVGGAGRRDGGDGVGGGGASGGGGGGGRVVRALGVVFLAGWLGVAGGRPAAAQIPVIDPAHIALNSYWHYVHYLQFGLQIYQQVQQIANQVEQIKYQLVALSKLQNPNWRQIGTLLQELQGIVNSGKSIGYALADAGGQFRAAFPGWQAWPDSTAYPAQTTRALDTMRASLAAVSWQSQSLAPGEETLAAIREQMETTAGHQQALEMLATLAGFQAQEALLSRQSLAVVANEQAVANGYWIDREAQAEATLEGVLQESALAGAENRSPGWGFVPGWWPFG